MHGPRPTTLVMMIAAEAATRLIPHPPNLTSVTALTLFGGAYLLYPKTFSGLIDRYVAAIPFFRGTLLGDLIHTTILFVGFRLLEGRCVAIREPGVAISSPSG